jgi:hypothetical protein
MKKLIVLVCGLLLLSGASYAGISDMEPASLLVFPFFAADDSEGEDTIISVTNVNHNFEFNPGTGRLYGEVFIHYFYVDGEDCDITNRRELLTPTDILTVLVSEHNPAMNRGFLLVIAEDANDRQPVRWDGWDTRGINEYPSGLIGDCVVGNGLLNFLWAIPAIGIKGYEGDAVGDQLDTLTSLRFGDEYESLPRFLYSSSFVEQGHLNTLSTLILLDPTLSNDTIDLYFFFYNNDEVLFSQTDDFKCWLVEDLDDIFNGSDNLGGIAATVPTGWIRIYADQEPLLGMIIQAIAGDTHSSARLLHHFGEGADGDIEF